MTVILPANNVNFTSSVMYHRLIAKLLTSMNSVECEITDLIRIDVCAICRSDSLQLSAADCLATVTETLPKFMSSFVSDIISTVCFVHTVHVANMYV